VVYVTNRADVDVGFIPFKLCACHIYFGFWILDFGLLEF